MTVEHLMIDRDQTVTPSIVQLTVSNWERYKHGTRWCHMSAVPVFIIKPIQYGVCYSVRARGANSACSGPPAARGRC